MDRERKKERGRGGGWASFYFGSYELHHVAGAADSGGD